MAFRCHLEELVSKEGTFKQGEPGVYRNSHCCR